jgi:hypothetical protein
MLNDSQVKILRKYLPNGALFDLIMFFLFLVAGPFVKPILNREIVYVGNNEKYLSWKIGIVYVCAAVAQIVGFWLKRRRIAQSFNHHSKWYGKSSFALVGGIFIAVMHLIIFGVLMVNDGVNYINNSRLWWLTTIKIIGVVLPTITALTVSSFGRHHSEIEKLSAVNTFWDVLGTILLAFSNFVVVSSLWALLMGDINLNFNDGKTLINILLTLLFFFAFLLLYLPARWAFLLMDYRSAYTWLRMAIVFIPFLKGIWLGW